MSPDITNLTSSSGVILSPTLILNTFSFFFRLVLLEIFFGC